MVKVIEQTDDQLLVEQNGKKYRIARRGIIIGVDGCASANLSRAMELQDKFGLVVRVIR